MFMIFIIAFLGVAFGSFINALVWRVYQQDLPQSKRAAKDADLAISTGRSMCVTCKHTLSALDLIPVFSWLFLKGKCRYCQTSISPQYPIVEVLTSVLFVISYLFWPYAFVGFVSYAVFASWLLTLVGMIALSVYDLRWMLLPNRILFPLIGLQCLAASLQIFTSGTPFKSFLVVMGSVAVASGLFYVLFQMSNGRWIGGGDVKLGILLGLLLMSPVKAVLMLFLASLIGLLFALQLYIGKKSQKRIIPFGPALIIATFICMLWGGAIIDWYSSNFLYL